jgi:RNA polymerase sigma-70 factor, ECF subfamily
VNTPRQALPSAASAGPADLEAVFRAYYAPMARTIARVTRDPARAEELAVEVFLRFPRENPPENPEAWLYRAAVRAGLDELRRQTRRSRFERVLRFVTPNRTPEEIHGASQEQDRVRTVLGAIGGRYASLLLLRAEGLSYGELAAALELNPASVGTMVSRAQQAFKKEYLTRYGTT